MKNIAIIPARSGSKGLPNKNIKKLCNHPLLAYSIIEAQKSLKFDKIFVSTDSSQYAQIAEDYDADASFLRSSELSSDTSGTWETVREVIKKFESMGKFYDNIMLLQPTSPLRTAQDIQNAFELLDEKNANAVISVCEMEHNPLWSNTIPANLSLDNFEDDKYQNSMRQELPTYYRMNGAIYLLTREELQKSILFKERCYAYIMDKISSIDIDEESDFLIAQSIMGGLNNIDEKIDR